MTMRSVMAAELASQLEVKMNPSEPGHACKNFTHNAIPVMLISSAPMPQGKLRSCLSITDGERTPSLTTILRAMCL